MLNFRVYFFLTLEKLHFIVATENTILSFLVLKKNVLLLLYCLKVIEIWYFVDNFLIFDKFSVFNSFVYSSPLNMLKNTQQSV
jgi:hypothetical protein